ncbi:hypothetical protein [Candidatus Entotheonella palauensis]|uniref:hypothetical protein n=1 Tax=Candidatus Entotheonella palauensis TaxID=93172 RepID=UPI000B7DE664|nr:hypothetical protein [Candidatus Entotheonella palauensis]
MSEQTLYFLRVLALVVGLAVPGIQNPDNPPVNGLKPTIIAAQVQESEKPVSASEHQVLRQKIVRHMEFVA